MERATATQVAAEAERERERTAAELAGYEGALRAALLASYVRANGSEFGFGAAWPQLRADHVHQQTLSNVQPKPETAATVVERALALRYPRSK